MRARVLSARLQPDQMILVQDRVVVAHPPAPCLASTTAGSITAVLAACRMLAKNASGLDQQHQKREVVLLVACRSWRSRGVDVPTTNIQHGAAAAVAGRPASRAERLGRLTSES